MNYTTTPPLKASVIIPTYNRSHLLDMSLLSLLHQHTPYKSFEVIIVDDGSTDNTQEIVMSYKDRLDLKYFFQKDEGYRVASARNLGIKHAKYDICIFIDSGILLEPSFLNEHLNHYKDENKKVSILGPVYGFCDDLANFSELKAYVDSRPSTDELFSFLRTNQIYRDVREVVFNKYLTSFEKQAAPWVYYWGGNASIRRSDLGEKEDIFDAIYDQNHGYEDCDLGYRLHKKGVEIKFEPKAECFHYPHDKIEGFRHMQWLNLQKFHKKHNSRATQLLVDLTLRGVHDLVQIDREMENHLKIINT